MTYKDERGEMWATARTYRSQACVRLLCLLKQLEKHKPPFFRWHLGKKMMGKVWESVLRKGKWKK